MVELITIIVIAGILAAFAAPRFFDRNVFDSRGFYDQLISTLRYAQKAAIAKHRFVCVSFPAHNSVTVTYGTTQYCVDGTLTSPAGDPYPLINMQASFSGGVPPAMFYFDALGRSSARQDISVRDYAAHIIVEAETGYVH